MGRTLDVLRGVDLEIKDREMIGIVGPSGAGKSTLLHCIGTLDVPTRGSIRLAGEELMTTMSGPGWRSCATARSGSSSSSITCSPSSTRSRT